MEHLPFLDSLLPCEEPRKNTSLDGAPKIGTWTPEEGFKLNGTPHGLAKVSESDDDETGGADDDDGDGGGGHGDGDGKTDGATNEGDNGDSNDSDQASQSGSEPDEAPKDQKTPDQCDKARDDPGLGLMATLPKELRDEIYDLCTQEKQYDIEQCIGPLRFQVHAPLSHCRLISKTFSREYEARAPANTLLILGKFRGGYTFQLGDGASKHIPDPQTFPTPGDYTNTVAQYGDLKVTPFDVAGLRCEIPSPPQVLVNRMPTTPAGTFGLDLRLYQDPRSDFLGFRRVFSDLSTDFTPGHTRLGPGALPLHDLNFVLEGDWDSQYNRYDLPVVGTWTPKGGLTFNKVADGALLRHSVSDEDTGVERYDAGL
jgi:hypothetical protein